MEIQGESSVLINGEECFSVRSFARLTQRSEATIRGLITNGNRKRRLSAIHLDGKPYVLAKELFEFPFIVKGRPADMGDFYETFYVDEETGELLRNEEIFKRTADEA